MRRQARISGGGALIVRSASALQVWLWFLIFIFQNEFRISRSIQPGYLDFDNLPETNFTCAGKVIGGYYADLETSCQMFHVCTVGQQEEPMDIKFLCLNGTVFDQETRVCERVDEVDCTKSEKFYSLNLELYGSTLPPPVIQEDVPKTESTEQSNKKAKPNLGEPDPSIDEAATTAHSKTHEFSTDAIDSTEDPVQDIKKEEHKKTQEFASSHHSIADQDEAEGPEKTHVLPLFHSFTGCDTTSSFNGRGKRTVFEAWKAYPNVTKGFQSLHEGDLEKADPDIQKFVITMYDSKHVIFSVIPEYRDEEDENVEYEEDYPNSPTTTVQAPITTTSSTTTTTTTKRPPPTTTVLSSTSLHHLSPVPQQISSPLPTFSSISPSAIPSSAPAAPSVDPALLSPQEFIYRHRGPGSEAISFQSFRPADGVYITHAPPQQYDHFQYESSRTAPRPGQPRPAAFVQRPQPQPFRPTTLDPRDQLLRPGPASQSSERHETSVKHRLPQYPSVLPAQRPLPFNPYYYDRKRSDDSSPEVESSLSARSVSPTSVTERPPTKPKSPPRVIVTASASVSDSNGKRLNYTVGNVVNAVKPIVPINYDDYRESDLIFDPFFLDVPKLQKRRKTRSNIRNRIFTVPATATVSPLLIADKKLKTTTVTHPSQTTSTRTPITKTTTPVAWNPNDYVDDNYEPYAYVPPAVIVAHNFKIQERPVSNRFEDKITRLKPLPGRIEMTKPTESAPQTTSSQDEGGHAGAGASSAASPPPPPPPPPRGAPLRPHALH